MNEELQSSNEELETMNEELRQRTDELNELNAFLEAILTSLRSAVVVLDRDMRVQVWNDQAQDLWGLRSEEVAEEHIMNLDIGLPVDQLHQPVRAALAGDDGAVEAHAGRCQPARAIDRLPGAADATAPAAGRVRRRHPVDGLGRRFEQRRCDSDGEGKRFHADTNVVQRCAGWPQETVWASRGPGSNSPGSMGSGLVHLRGDVDAGNCGELIAASTRALADRAADRGRHRRRRVRRLRVINVVARAAMVAQSSGGSLRLVNATAQTRRALEVSGMWERLTAGVDDGRAWHGGREGTAAVVVTPTSG